MSNSEENTINVFYFLKNTFSHSTIKWFGQALLQLKAAIIKMRLKVQTEINLK